MTGAAGIALGLFYWVSCLAFIIPYWYIFLLDKSAWNNHSYLFGLVSVLFLGTRANHFWSLDGYLGRVKSNSHVPLWNYAILRCQFFLLYFLAGLKKMDKDWIEGYSMTNLANHWVFYPFKILLTSEQVDYWIVHLNGFALDLSIGFWMFFDKTRPYAFIFCATFHLMNSQLFSIGMFPYVCLVTMPLFCHVDWPRKFTDKLFSRKPQTEVKLIESDCCIYTSNDERPNVVAAERRRHPVGMRGVVTWKHQLVVALLVSHVGVQLFLPYSHFITQGYNNWTNGLYGYSWDMMVHTWDTILVVVRVVDNDTGKEHFLDPEAWVQTDRWNKHGDMMVQYATCLRRNLLRERHPSHPNHAGISRYLSGDNISIHFDVWCSLNARFQQRMLDPRVDLLTADWSPFSRVSWIMPLLTEFSSWRQKISELEKHVHSWSNYTDALFVADFPGLALENYISPDLSNVTLTVLEGTVVVERDTGDSAGTGPPRNRTLTEGANTAVVSGQFHKVHTISTRPACYMYSYLNQSQQAQSGQHQSRSGRPGLWQELLTRLDNMMRAIGLVSNSFLNVLYSVPMVKRIRVG